MNKYYDMIAKDYDELVKEDIKQKVFPYASYDDIQDIIASDIFGNKHIQHANILDIGIGTGSLYEKLTPGKVHITGIDHSEKMLEICKLRYPNATLYQQDILEGLPDEVACKPYDYIIVNFLFKHFDLDQVMRTIRRLGACLAPFGKIYIGDILFENETKKTNYLTHHPENHHPVYHYHTFESIIACIDDVWELSFMEMDAYSGLLIIEKYYESSLHLDDSLVKYKTNTVKWKSTLSHRHRE